MVLNLAFPARCTLATDSFVSRPSGVVSKPSVGDCLAKRMGKRPLFTFRMSEKNMGNSNGKPSVKHTLRHCSMPVVAEHLLAPAPFCARRAVPPGVSIGDRDRPPAARGALTGRGRRISGPASYAGRERRQRKHLAEAAAGNLGQRCAPVPAVRVSLCFAGFSSTDGGSLRQMSGSVRHVA